jgi:hypothetical protein
VSARVEVEIEQLVLHGLSAADGARVAHSLEHELGVLLEDRAPRAPLNVDRLPLLVLPRGAAERPATLGAAAARAVHGALLR